MTFKKAAFTFVLLFVSNGLMANGFKDGLWELNSTSSKGAVNQMKVVDSKLEKKCLKADYLTDMAQQMSKMAALPYGCQPTSKNVSQTKLYMTLICAHEDSLIKTTYDISFNNTTMSAKSVSSATKDGIAYQEVTKTTGRYLGACPQ